MEKLDSKRLQTRLFRKIEEKAGSKKVVPLLCDILSINKSSAYNRMNGTTTIDLDELVLLLNAFEIPMHELAQQEKPKGIFVADSAAQQIRSGREHLGKILQNFQAFGHAKDLRLWVCTDEITYFQCMNFKELALFKMFTYAHINWQLPYTEALKFDPDTYPEREVYEALMLPILNAYNTMPTIEIWSDEIYDNAVKQINYFSSTGQIAKPEITRLLFEQLEQLCEHQYEMAKKGAKYAYSSKKRMPEGICGQFDLYHNSMAPTGIVLIAESRQQNGVFLIFDDPNFIFVEESSFLCYTKNWMANLRKKCVKISAEAEGHRRIYFEHLKKRVRQ